jgi:hypothetical protein
MPELGEAGPDKGAEGTHQPIADTDAQEEGER